MQTCRKDKLPYGVETTLIKERGTVPAPHRDEAAPPAVGHMSPRDIWVIFDLRTPSPGLQAPRLWR